jgi:NADP-dependent 3-hydroxy acid dehydrogenase YdfG
MKIAVTGHADGFGKVVADTFQKNGHEIVGFSLENGHDITKREDRLVMLPLIVECDVFINCAYSREVHDLSQCHILIGVYGEWQKTDKHIVNMGSVAPDSKRTDFEFGRMIYRGTKGGLDVVSDELAMAGKCRVTNIRPDWMQSKELSRLEKIYQRKAKNPLVYQDVADLIYDIVELGDKITITSLTLKGTRT